MTSFPLYDELAKEALKEPKEINIKNLAATLSSLSQEHNEMIFLLIYHHSVINNNKFAKVPYGGSVMPGGKGVLFSITSIPPALQQIIVKYIEKY
jgi:hypothetical protein